MDNTKNTSFPATWNVHDDNALKLLDWSGKTNVYIDNFDFTGACGRESFRGIRQRWEKWRSNEIVLSRLVGCNYGY